MFQTLIVQPIYNVLVALYGLLPGHDLGLSLILFTVLIRLAMWPLLKKQLHQSRVMRDLQPELAKIKKAAAGDRQKEGRLMMELYKEKGISPFGTIGLTLVQLPLFIGVFQAARDLTQQLDRISTFTYGFVRDIPHVQSVINNRSNFNFESFGFIDLSQKAFSNGKIYIPVLILAIAATVFQYIQSKQLIPQPKEKKRLRDILRNSAATGNQPAQEDMSAAMGSSMLFLMPILTMLFAVAAQGAMVVYLLVGSLVGIFQQSLIFRRDTDEMEAEVVSVHTKPVSESKSEPAEKVTKGKVVTKTRIISPASPQKPTTKRKKR
ncbi:MAG: YidC/Oxa1 family membrane protein insertase [Candidatus Saccharimonadales bacterium]